jgi:hypothetical protein
MRRLVITLVLAVSIVWAQLAGAATIATVGFAPQNSSSITSSLTTSVTNGINYSFDVYVTVLVSDQIVAAYDLDVKYNFTMLRPSLTNPAAFTSILGDTQGVDYLATGNTNAYGTVNLSAVSFLWDTGLQAKQQTGSASVTPVNLKLATLSFFAVDSGETTLYFGSSSTPLVRDIKGLENAVIYDAVPEPSTYLLALVAGIAVAIAARRQRSKSS